MRHAWKETLADWNRLWFTPQSPQYVGVLRMAVCGLAAIQFSLMLFSGTEWFGETGWLASDVSRYLIGDGLEGTGSSYRWSVLYRYPQMAPLVAIVGMIASVVAVLGIGSRVAILIAWLGLATFHHRAPMLASLHEPLLSAMLAYLMIDPGKLDWRWQPAIASGVDRWTTNLAVRLIQCHLLIWILFSLGSMLGFATWWNGDAGWELIQQKRGLLRLGEGSQWIGQFLTHAAIYLQLGIVVCILRANWRWIGRFLMYVFVLCMLLLVADWMYAAVLLAASFAIWPVRFTLRKISNETQ